MAELVLKPGQIDCSKNRKGETIGTRTKRSMGPQSDINYIFNRYKRTGQLVDPAQQSNRKALWGDFTQVGDFQEMQDKIVRGKEVFEALPAHVRDRFRNDPARLVDFMTDEGNRKEAQELGLIPEDPKPTETQEKASAPAEPAAEPKES